MESQPVGEYDSSVLKDSRRIKIGEGEYKPFDDIHYIPVEKEDMVKKPKHYQIIPEKDVEALDVIKAILGDEGFKAYCKGNAIKYLLRNKWDSEEDVQKAQTYLGFYLGEARE